MQARAPNWDLAAVKSEDKAYMLSLFKQRRGGVWRVVGIRVGLPRHDVEVEGVVVKDDAVLELRVRSCTCNAQAHV